MGKKSGKKKGKKGSLVEQSRDVTSAAGQPEPFADRTPGWAPSLASLAAPSKVDDKGVRTWRRSDLMAAGGAPQELLLKFGKAQASERLLAHAGYLAKADRATDLALKVGYQRLAAEAISTEESPQDADIVVLRKAIGPRGWALGSMNERPIRNEIMRSERAR